MGHANSKRRIATEEGMGAAVPRPPTPPRPSPAPSPPPSPALVTYTLPFTASLIRHDDEVPSNGLQKRGRYELEEANWGEYLYATMRDASHERYSTPVRLDDDVSLEDWEVTISSSVTLVKDPKGFTSAVYSGTLTWTSVACPLKRVQEEINWRIGDRMSMYEIDYDDWHVYIEPGTVSVSA